MSTGYCRSLSRFYVKLTVHAVSIDQTTKRLFIFSLNPISFLVAFWQLVYICEWVHGAEWVIVHLAYAYNCVENLVIPEFAREYKLNWFRSEINRGTLWWAIDCFLWSNEIKADECSAPSGGLWLYSLLCAPFTPMICWKWKPFFSLSFLSWYTSYYTCNQFCITLLPLSFNQFDQTLLYRPYSQIPVLLVGFTEVSHPLPSALNPHRDLKESCKGGIVLPAWTEV